MSHSLTRILFTGTLSPILEAVHRICPKFLGARKLRFGPSVQVSRSILHFTGKNGFVTATKIGTINNYFVAATKNFAAATKNFAAATKRFVDKTEHFVVTKYCCYPYFNK